MSIASLVKAGENIDTTTKQSVWAAITHAKQINEDNVGLYTDEQIESGNRIHKYVQTMFPNNRTFLNYRKKFIAVKVEDVSLVSAQSTHAQLLEDLCELSKVEIAGHGNNIIFRIAR